MNAVDRDHYVTFVVRGVEFGVALDRVGEVLPIGPWEAAPSAPPCVVGVMHARGAVMPVIDLAAKLGETPGAVAALGSIGVVFVDVGGERRAFGLLAERIGQVVALGPEGIARAPAFGAHRVACLLGIGLVDERLVMLLDVDRILLREELAQVSSLFTPAPEARGSG